MRSGEPDPGSPLAPPAPATGAARTGPEDDSPGGASLGPMASALAGARVRSIGISVIATLAVVYTFRAARAFFIPVAFALLLSFLLSPLVRVARRARIPAGVSAAAIVLALAGLLAGGVYELSAPAQAWLASAPATVGRVTAHLHRALSPVARVTRTAEQVARVARVGTGAEPVARVTVVGPSLAQRFFGTTETVLAALIEVLVLLYFLLAAGDLFLRKLVKVLPDSDSKRTAVQVARATEASISTYLITSALIYTAEGMVVAIVLHFLGMPDAVLWGTLVAVLEFVPYLGAVTIVIVLGLAALAQFGAVVWALVVPAAYVAVNLLQANFVTPVVLGRRLALNPVAIILGLAFWWHVWGFAGAFLAVPLLAALKIFCDHVPTLTPIGEFLGPGDSRDSRTIVRYTPGPG